MDPSSAAGRPVLSLSKGWMAKQYAEPSGQQRRAKSITP
jgi:hypothetical protein